MRKKLTALFLGACILTVSAPVCVLADTEAEAADLFTDGTTDGTINTFISGLVEKTTEETLKYQEDVTVAKRIAKEKEIRKKAADAAREAAQAAKKAEEERLAHRQEIVDFALQFEGNPYVYGGTSLTNGADCSGFVMSVFKEFGYELPRVASAQCEASTKKEVADIEIGDLVFYGDYDINHVALYIGDGKIIHASTAATGIKISDYDYQHPVAVGTYVK